MATEKQRKTFLSYSRFNRDFAIRLAKELKAEGFDIWLDQLDIPAGARWDREVERALKESEIFMIILTPSSVDSENVLDEIGYAIDNRKRFLPVLLENCEVPLRLRRFQYVDFTNKSFDDGVNSAKDLLRSLIAQPTIQRGVIPAESQDQAAKAEADRKAREEADLLAAQKANADRLAKQKAEDERSAKTRADREAKAEADRKAREEAERLAAQEAQAEPVQARPVMAATTQKKPVSRGLMIGIAVVAVLCVVGLGIGITSLLSPGATATEAPIYEEPAATEAPVVEEPAATEAPVVEEPAATEAPSESIELTLWYSYDSGTAEEAALVVLLDQAALDMPGIRISALQIPFNEIHDRYASEVAAGGGPDIVLNTPAFIRNYARDGLIADITDLVAGRLDGYSQLGIDGMSLDGRLYGIPESLVGVGFWYDRSRLPTPPADTDELMAMLSEGAPIGLGYDCYSVYGFYSTFGGRILDADWNFIADQTGVGDAFYYLNGLYQISKSNGISVNGNFDVTLLTDGQFSAVVNGSWALSAYRDALGDNLAVAPLPSGPGGPAAPLVDVNGFFINPNSPNQQADLEAALYLTNAYSQTVMMEQAAHVPVRNDIAITDPLLQGFVDAFNMGATISQQVPEMDKYWSYFCSTDQIFEAGTDPYEWVSGVTAAANQ